MSGYWSEVLRRWPKAFVDFTKSWWFWFVNVIPGLRTFLSADLQNSIGLDALPPWLLGASIVASVFVALLLAGRDHYRELSDAHAKRGDDLVAATEAQTRAESERDSYKAKVDRVWNSDILALEKFAIEGQEIIQVIQSKAWEESSGKLRVDWVRKVEAFINAYRPTYLVPVPQRATEHARGVLGRRRPHARRQQHEDQSRQPCDYHLPTPPARLHEGLVPFSSALQPAQSPTASGTCNERATNSLGAWRCRSYRALRLRTQLNGLETWRSSRR